MRIWLVQTGESHPFQPGARKMRTSMLADELRSRGHEVLWWSTNFFHPTKTLLAPGFKKIEMAPDFEIRLLKGIPYRKNISLRRYAHYKKLGLTFSQSTKGLPRPDLIVTALPDYDLSAAMVRYAKENSVPILVDVQDLWPDIFVDALPRRMRWMGKGLLAHDFKKVSTLLADATGIIACSTRYLDWGLEKAGRSRAKDDAVFYHGYPSPKVSSGEGLRPEFAEALKRLEGKTVFTFLGTFGRSYDIELLVNAARRLKGDPRIHVVLAGQGEKFAWAKEQSRDLDNLTLTGWVNEPEIAALLGKSHVGLVTYTRSAPQSLSYKPFEYMAYGLPLLSSLKDEMRDLISEHGMGETYRAEDLEDFLTKVQKLTADDKKLAQSAKQAKETFANRFCKEQIYGSYANHIERILNNR